MNKITLKIFTSILSLAFIMVILGGLFTSVSAQEDVLDSKLIEALKAEGMIESEAIILADANIYNAKILSQKDNIFDISFDIANGAGAQAQIKYLVRLLSVDENGEESLVHEKIYYNEEVNISENSRASKVIKYSAPEYLSGRYQLWLIAQNKGMLMIGPAVLGDVELKGNGGYVKILPKSCSLRIDGDSDKYTLGEGVGIKESESLTLYCNAINNFNNKITAIPSFETRYRFRTGDIVQTTTPTNQPIIFSAGEEKEISIKLPRAFLPQTYHALFTLKNDKGEEISNTIQSYYRLYGASAIIQNIILDKDLYKKGEMANISFIWTLLVDSFEGFRFGATELGTLFLNMSIVDDKGGECIKKIENRKLGDPKSVRVSINETIIKNCSNPKITASITDENGKIFDQKDFSIKSSQGAKNLKNTERGQKEIKEKDSINILATMIFTVIILLLIYSILKALSRKDDNGVRKNSLSIITKSIILLLFIAGMFVIQTEKVDAAVFGVDGWVFKANIDKGTYAPNETITVTGRISLGSGYYSSSPRYYWMTADGIGVFTKPNPSGTASFPAPSVPGNYTVKIIGYTKESKRPLFWTSVNLPYTVVAPAPTVDLTASPTSTTYGATSTLSWTSTNADSCTASGDWSGAKPTLGNQSTESLTSIKTYTLTCSGPGGNATDSVTVVIVPQPTDIGLRVSDGTQIFVVDVEPLGTLTSPLRIADKNGDIYGVKLVDPSDSRAIPVYIKVGAGIKALKKFETSTYSWKIGSYGACGLPQVVTNDEMVYEGGDGCDQKIKKETTTTTSKSRSVQCESDSGQIVNDSFCEGVKPNETLVCTTKVRYLGWFNDMYYCGGLGGPVRWFKGLDTDAGSYNWSITYYDHGWYTRTGSGSKADGVTQVNTGVQTHQGSGWGQNYFDVTF